ncbi:MAG: right-handed parallel beta-helix repeat-containing protein [Oligosphaeraceae bacterium]
MTTDTGRFGPRMTFVSGVRYEADRRHYDILPEDIIPMSGVGYTPPDGRLDCAFVLDGVEDVEVDLGGAELLFHGRMTPFVLRNCRNVTLRNFSVDYDRPFYSQAEIVSVSGDTMVLRMDAAFPCGMVDGSFCALAPHWVQRLDRGHMLWQPFDPVTRAPAWHGEMVLAVFADYDEEENPPCSIQHFSIEPGEGEREWVVRGPVRPSWRPGMVMAMTHESRVNNAILMERCEQVTVENVRLIHGSAMGLVAMFCCDLTIRRFDMYCDSRSAGLVSINADSIHCFHCTGRILVEDCIFESMLDDAINIHGNYNRVSAVSGRRLTLEVLAAAGLRHVRWYVPGDRLAIHRGATVETRCVRTVRTVAYPAPGRVTVELDGDAEGVAPGDVVELDAMPEIVIRRCVTGRNRPRGFLLSSGGPTLVESCVFGNCSCAIHFTGDMTYWYESGPVRDVTIRHCHFHNCGYCTSDYPIVADPQVRVTEAQPCYHRGITIEDNVFESFSTGLLSAHHTENIVMRRNRWIEAGDYPPVRVEPVRLRECSNCSIQPHGLGGVSPRA